MKTDLDSIAFDHYQRYASSANLLEALGGDVASVLEVGANRQRLLARFLPQVRFVFSDLAPSSEMEEGFVQADATALPFEDGEFDAVVCLDVIEHMPCDVRERAITEMVRASRRMVVVAFPVSQPWVHAAEARADSYWRRYFGSAYPWLEEHQEFGLVDGDQVEAALRAAGVHVLRFGHADVNIWTGLMGAHFIKEKLPEFQGLVAAADHLYNTSVFRGDRGDTCYREFFIGVRHEADLDRVRGLEMFAASRDESAASLLAGLADTLQPIADRTLRAEAGWSQTAEHVRQVEMSLGEALQRAEQAEAYAAKALEEWHLAAERVSEADASLDVAREGWATSAARVRELEDHAGSLTDRLNVTAIELASKAAALNVSHEKNERLTADAERLQVQVKRLQRRHRRMLQMAAAALVLCSAIVAYWHWAG